jgi:hypothetical protein
METTETEPTPHTQTPSPLAHSEAPASPQSRLVLQLPEPVPWPNPVDGFLLITDLVRLLARYVVLPPSAAETLALWVIHTYAFHLRHISTYIGVESPEKRCGKTTLLTILSELVNRPIVASNISPPALFRVIEETRPTLLIDEADTLLQGNDELRGILNAGYTQRTGYVVRVAPTPPVAPKLRAKADAPSALLRFSCWCPKIIAAIGRLPDTLADRCIVIRMQRKTPKEQCERLRLLAGEAESIRRQCARFVADHAADIASARPDIPPALNDRAADIWEPLFAIADLAGGDWPQFARQAATNLTASAQDQNPISSLLLDIAVVFTVTQTDRLFTRNLLIALNALTDRAWKELNKGKPINDLWLSRQLRPYGIRPRSFWIGGSQGRGYLKDDFHDVFRRYVPNSDLDALFQDTKTPRQETVPDALTGHS